MDIKNSIVAILNTDNEIVGALTRPGGFLPLRREGMLTLEVPNRAKISRT